MQGALGFGMLMGPTISAGFYPLFNLIGGVWGYVGTFFAFGTIIGICGVLVVS
jgi:hypothetical protein